MVATKPRVGLGRVVLDAELEARRRGDRRIGTEHVLLALLIDPESRPARALGRTLAEARDALHALDHDALATVGITGPMIDLGVALPRGGRPQLTPGAATVFKSLGKLSRRGRLGLEHVLLALLAREKPDPAGVLLDAMGVDRAEVRQRLAEA